MASSSTKSAAWTVNISNPMWHKFDSKILSGRKKVEGHFSERGLVTKTHPRRVRMRLFGGERK